MLKVVRFLDRTTPGGLINGASHGVCDNVRIHDDVTLFMARCPAHGLDERRCRSQIALFVGVQDGNKADLRQVKPLS